MPAKILIADDHPLFRDALISIVSPVLPGCEILQAIDYAQTREMMSKHDFKLAFIDLNMPDTSGLADLALIKKESPQTPVIVVSAHEGADVITTCLGYGASGYIVKSSDPAEIRGAIETVLNGDVCVPANYQPADNEISDSAAMINLLTPSQLKVLLEVGKGKLNKQIAYDLEISEATVKAHITSVFRKLGINNRTQAVIFAKENETELLELK